MTVPRNLVSVPCRSFLSSQVHLGGQERTESPTEFPVEKYQLVVKERNTNVPQKQEQGDRGSLERVREGLAVACVSAINCRVTSRPKPSKQLTMMGVCYLACGLNSLLSSLQVRLSAGQAALFSGTPDPLKIKFNFTTDFCSL